MQILQHLADSLSGQYLLSIITKMNENIVEITT